MADRIMTGRDVAVDRAVVEAYAMALVVAHGSDNSVPALASNGGKTVVSVNGFMDTITLQGNGSVTMSSHEAIQTAIMLLAGAHAVREIAESLNHGAVA